MNEIQILSGNQVLKRSEKRKAGELSFGAPKENVSFLPGALHREEVNTFSVQFSCSVVSDSATPWIVACQASLSITNSQSLLKRMSIELVMPSNHLILCRPLLLPPSIFPSIRVFSNESFGQC